MYPQMAVCDRPDNSSQPAGGFAHKLSDLMVCRLRRDGRLFCRVWMKTKGDGPQGAQQVAAVLPKPALPPPKRRVVRGNGRERFRLRDDLFDACRFIPFVRHEAIRELMMDLSAAAAPQTTDDEEAAISISARQLPPPTANDDEPFAAARAWHHFCTPNKKRRVSSQPARTLLQ